MLTEIGMEILPGPNPKKAKKVTGVIDPPSKPDSVRGGPYGHLPDHPSVDTGKPFTKTQKEKILAENEARNGGQLRDDVTGEPLVRPQQHTRGVTPPDNEAQIDHVYPRSQGGPNTNSNAEVRARIHNLKKGDKIE
jgi:hypothetical protein